MDSLSFLYDPLSSKPSLHIHIRGNDRDISVELPTIDIDADYLAIPTIDYSFIMEIIPKIWDSYVSTLNVIEAYNMTLKPDSDSMVLESEGDIAPMAIKIHTNRSISNYNKRDLTRYTKITQCDETPITTLNYNLVRQMNQLNKSMSKLHICLHSGMPALFRYTCGDSITVQLYIAPKITDDDG
jgi:hypothetical protein